MTAAPKGGPALRRPFRYLSASRGLGSRLRAAQEVSRVVEEACAGRRLRVRFSGPGQAVLLEGGALRLVVRTPSEAYQIRNVMPTIRAALERAFGGAVRSVSVSVNPALHDPLPSGGDAPQGEPRLPSPKAAREALEKAKRLPEGSRIRESLENLARSLED
ncbi:hypothetical protein MUN46_001515 [Mesosutterella sp. AGMB02718]|uniref:DUF721 domain-containing protein n=1 Tax=Mesosutterella faecium TaxID=2925194 RepID=A0ABT7IKX4_9BURK|nr:hypothetical protein [Mesosutterella sp. AGMB02718]MDL2058635.1 hypothetical protein [Mesosutterella sp. AGMB02718]